MEVVNFRDFTFTGEEGFLVTQHNNANPCLFLLSSTLLCSFFLSLLYFIIRLFYLLEKPNLQFSNPKIAVFELPFLFLAEGSSRARPESWKPRILTLQSLNRTTVQRWGRLGVVERVALVR
ncbi:hypothetical protein VNO80_13204 [Phaseolus coccineus]|uniref:Uncharacterized protein n=1 Tax=Phaseolus coccineus TaxID=3886 RepID=A0AAN9N2L9_PHACN